MDILMAIAVFIIIWMAVRQKKLKKQNLLLIKQLDDADASKRRLKVAMSYIPYELMQYNLLNGHLGTIDRKTGAVRDLADEEKHKAADLISGKTVYPGLKKFTGTLKQRFADGEEIVEQVLEGYAGSTTKYGKITATAVFNSMGLPTEAVCVIEDVTSTELEQQRITRQLKEAKNESMQDKLTGLYNKEGFFTVAQELIDDNQSKRAALIFMDLDNFKSLNDCLGHMTGDKALKDVAEKLRDLFPERDVMARFGGDEFCVLTFDNTVSGLRDKLDTMIVRMRETYSNAKSSVTVSASVGVTQMPRFGTDVRQVMALSDKALYCAKEKGKNTFTIYEDGMEPHGYVGRGA